MGSSRRVMSRKAACFASIIAPAALSICYLYFQREKQGDHEAIADQYVVCTPQWKQPAAARPGGAVSELPRRPLRSGED